MTDMRDFQPSSQSDHARWPARLRLALLAHLHSLVAACRGLADLHRCSSTLHALSLCHLSLDSLDKSSVEGGRVKKTKGRRGDGSSERLCSVIGKPWLGALGSSTIPAGPIVGSNTIIQSQAKAGIPSFPSFPSTRRYHRNSPTPTISDCALICTKATSTRPARQLTTCW